MAQTYEQELELFQNRWKMPNYNLEKTTETAERLRYANAFLTGDRVDISLAGQFIRGLSKTLTMYLQMNTQLNENGKYMSSFDAQEFFDDFERLAEAKYRSEFGDDQASNRKKYAGADVKDINAEFSKILNKINKPLPTLWMEKLKKGSMDMSNLQEITTQSYDNVAKKYYNDENEMAGSLTNVVAAYEAMKQLRASREGFFGWFWKLFNRDQNRAEKAYLNELVGQVNGLKEKGYNIDRITRNLTDKTVLGRDVNAQKTVAKTQGKEATKTQESPANTQTKAVKFAPVAGQISQKANDVFINNLAAILHEELPVNNMPKIVRVVEYQTELLSIREAINNLNENFDRAVENGGDPKKEMAKVVHGVFKETEKVFSQHIIETGLDKIEGLKTAAQIITNNLTAAAIYPNELSDVVDTYIEQNVAIYEEIVTNGKKYGEEIENYKKMLEEDVLADEREQLFNKENPFPENNIDKTAPVNQQPQITAPTIDRK